MRFTADLHIHSPYSRSTSGQMNLEGLHRWAQLKGIAVVGTGDFTHPAWFAELRAKLEPAEPGLFKLRDEHAAPVDAEVPRACRARVRFMLSAEISCIYKRADKTRKVHNLVYCPDLASAGAVNVELMKIGNLGSDGRPIIGLDSEELLKIVKGVGADCILVPAHAWTPHFSIFGAFSGFESLQECYGDLAGEIFAIETGLSSDPPMNRRLSMLDRIALISNSDAHSPAKLLREGNVFEAELDYGSIWGAVRDRDPQRFIETIEFFPEQGKYHYDGHRACGVRLHPRETMSCEQGRCPECGRKITVGVMSRVEELADRPESTPMHGFTPYRSVIPLMDILSEVLEVGAQSKKVARAYETLLSALGPEYELLTSVPLDDIAAALPGPTARAVKLMRLGQVNIEPGYDGEFGRVHIMGGEPDPGGEPQLSLF